MPATTAAAAVRAVFVPWSRPLEARVGFMYLDMHKKRDPVTGEEVLDPLVTTGVGNLIDPIAYALRLPWRRNADDRAATEAEIRAEWARVKARVDLAPKGLESRRAITTLHLTDAAIDELCLAHLDNDARVLRARFPGMDEWPADALLGIHAMAWGMGAWFFRKYPRFCRAVEALDFDAASRDCTSPSFNADRNAAIVRLFQNADQVIAAGLDRATLLWVGDAKTAQAPL